MFSSLLLPLFALLPSLTHAHPHHVHSHAARNNDGSGTYTNAAVQRLFDGNARFLKEYEKDPRAFLGELGVSQAPTYAYVGCSDSRVPENTIFDAKPGEIFTIRNAGNLYNDDDLGSTSTMAFGIGALGVQHIIVMGHTDCGAVAAAMYPDPNPVDLPSQRIQQWITPVRELYWSSNQTDIVNFRSQHNRSTDPPNFDIHTPYFLALIDENVRANVANLANDTAVQQAWADWTEYQKNPMKSTSSSSKRNNDNATADVSAEDTPLYPYNEMPEIWVHGFVYDTETGIVRDLNVSQGPPGATLKSPKARRAT